MSEKYIEIPIHLESFVKLTPRVVDVRTMFDLPLVDKLTRDWNVKFPDCDTHWNVGLIVGPSGSGKTRIARELWPSAWAENYVWPSDESVLDGFPGHLTAGEITKLLSAVGFASPPSWLQPFHTLSNGEQFRANLARAIVDERNPVVIDEFTSVVDRTVAQIGSAAFARSVRERNKQVILLSCHYDVIEWLQPDWIYRTDVGEFEWRRLQRRPDVNLEVRQCSRAVWEVFRHHHYLTHKLPGGAHILVGLVNGREAAFSASIPFPVSGQYFPMRHISRIVVTPDFQGIGLGNRLAEITASLWTSRKWRCSIVSTHPSIIAHCFRRKELWKCLKKPSIVKPSIRTAEIKSYSSFRRATASFEYVGPPADQNVASNLEIPSLH
jgi:GNAT superfamily N-acetyltransferase